MLASPPLPCACCTAPLTSWWWRSPPTWCSTATTTGGTPYTSEWPSSSSSWQTSASIRYEWGRPAWSQFTSSSFTSFSRWVHAAVLKFSSTVYARLQHGFMVPQRLDYATSGVLVAPLTASACRAACAALQSRARGGADSTSSAQKFYLALLRGHVSCEPGRVFCVDRPVGEDPRPEWRGIRMSCSADAVNPRDAVTKVAVLNRCEIELYLRICSFDFYCSFQGRVRRLPGHPGAAPPPERSAAPTALPLPLAGAQDRRGLHLLRQEGHRAIQDVSARAAPCT